MRPITLPMEYNVAWCGPPTDLHNAGSMVAAAPKAVPAITTLTLIIAPSEKYISREVEVIMHTNVVVQVSLRILGKRSDNPPTENLATELMMKKVVWIEDTLSRNPAATANVDKFDIHSNDVPQITVLAVQHMKKQSEDST